MKIYLIGYMFSGKSTLGKVLARELGYDFIDLDILFEQKYKTSIPIFFKKYGEQAFRIIEQQVLRSTETLDNCVIATGGGTPCFFDNIEWINAHGISVFFNPPVCKILYYASISKKTRPILANKTDEERALYVEQQLQQRLPFYTQAHITFHTDNDIGELVKIITQKQNHL